MASRVPVTRFPWNSAFFYLYFTCVYLPYAAMRLFLFCLQRSSDTVERSRAPCAFCSEHKCRQSAKVAGRAAHISPRAHTHATCYTLCTRAQIRLGATTNTSHTHATHNNSLTPKKTRRCINHTHSCLRFFAELMCNASIRIRDIREYVWYTHIYSTKNITAIL